ncbi:MBL fold metallo-hydrolase [Clostridium estertheticum]|uniref:MBL fold metallo-hydrolase n=1 Tax=Clostridium estertheticum TaxID=238834 RepID=UPI001CCD5F36|nr:MBL fold metallo-hydrolase [Clostridium estertheticum]MBZ9609909.1 MBL fold metallo-hydrolase [Clostridium estertheticum]
MEKGNEVDVVMKEHELYILNTKLYNFSNYCFLIKDKQSSSAIIIDPSWELDKVEYMLKKSKSKLVAIFLSHSHFDHVNLVNSLVYRHNSIVYMSEKEIDYYDFRCLNLYPLKNNEEIIIGNMKIQCLLTPGHTKGSMCYQIYDNVFTGDTVFIEGCGLCDFNGGSATDMFYSIKFLRDNIPLDTKVFPGHSYGEELGQVFKAVMNKNIYFQIKNLEQFVDFRLRKGQKKLFDFK